MLSANASAQGIPPLDCSGNTIYQFQRPSGGGTVGRLNTVNVATTTNGSTADVTATEAAARLPAATGNALGITEGGQGAWALAHSRVASPSPHIATATARNARTVRAGHASRS